MAQSNQVLSMDRAAAFFYSRLSTSATVNDSDTPFLIESKVIWTPQKAKLSDEP